MSEWSGASPGEAHTAHSPDVTGDEAVSPISSGDGLGGQPLPRIQHGKSQPYPLGLL